MTAVTSGAENQKARQGRTETDTDSGTRRFSPFPSVTDALRSLRKFPAEAQNACDKGNSKNQEQLRSGSAAECAEAGQRRCHDQLLLQFRHPGQPDTDTADKKPYRYGPGAVFAGTFPRTGYGSQVESDWESGSYAILRNISSDRILLENPGKRVYGTCKKYRETNLRSGDCHCCKRGIGISYGHIPA